MQELGDPTGIGLGWNWVVLPLIFYAYFSVTLMMIAAKTGAAQPWLAWVPIVNLWLMCRVGNRPGWWVLLILIPFLNIIFVALVWIGIAAARGKPGWIGLLVVIPVLGCLAPLYLALGNGGGAHARAATAGSVPGGSPGEPTVPDRCPSCGSAIGPCDAFCGECGYELSDTAPVAEGQAAATKHGRGKLIAAVAVAVVLVVGVWWIVRALSGPERADRVAVELPQRMAGTLTEFPVDTERSAPARPVSMTSQKLGSEQPSGGAQVPEHWLPPGARPEQLPERADALTSAVYRSGEEEPPVNVHVMSTGSPTDDGRTIARNVEEATSGELSQVRIDSARGEVYSGYKIGTPQETTFVLSKPAGNTVIIIYAPVPAAAEVAARLAANVGNGQGLLDDPALTQSMWLLPPSAPAGLELVGINTATPEDLGWSASSVDGPGGYGLDPPVHELLSWLAQALPGRITSALYRGPQREEWNLLAGSYPTALQANAAWLLLRGALAAGGWRTTTTAGGTALVRESDDGRLLLQKSGEHLILAQGPGSAGEESLANLAASMQTGESAPVAGRSAAGTDSGEEPEDAEAAIEEAAIEEAAKYTLSGVWEGDCAGDVSGRFIRPQGFDLFIDWEEGVTGIFFDYDSNWLYEVTGRLDESGYIAVMAPTDGGGRLEMVGRTDLGPHRMFITGSGDFRMLPGSRQCSGTWTGDPIPD